MNKVKFVARSVALVCLGAMGVAQAGLYVGVGGGAVRLDPDLDAGIEINDDGRDSGYKAVIGKRMGSKGSIELYFADLGTAEFSPAAEVDYSSYGINTVWDVWSAGKGHKKPTVFLTLGMGALETEAKGADANRDDDILGNAGIGARFYLRHGLSVRASLEVFDGDASMASALLVKDFGGHHRRHHMKDCDKPCKHGKKHHKMKKHQQMQEDSAIELPEVVTAATTTAAVENAVQVEQAEKSVKTADLSQLKNVYFNRDSAFITEMGAGAIEQLLNTMNDYPKMRVEIQGHTDTAEGGNARALSELRAQRVSNYLWQKGIAPDRLSLIAYADSQPAAAEGDSRLNRRVQFRILSVD
ncbi:MAG: OmpA family protein [Granulosicoccaceae bacterium]